MKNTLLSKTFSRILIFCIIKRKSFCKELKKITNMKIISKNFFKCIFALE